MELDVDVNRAWERFKEKVRQEPVPTAWTRVRADGQADAAQAAGVATGTEASADPGRNRLVVSTRGIEPGVLREGVSSPAFGGVTRTVFGGSSSPIAAAHKSGIRRHRRGWQSVAAVAAVLAVVAGGYATPWGQKVAADAMQTFYVKQLAPISQSDLQNVQSALQHANGNQSFNLPQYGSVNVKSTPLAVSDPATKAAIASATGYALPGASGGGAAGSQQGVSYSYSPAETVTLRLHVQAINQMLRQLGGKVMLPASADNVPIVLSIPVRVTESLGVSGQFENLNILRAPSLYVPGSVDVNQVRQAIVDLPFMPADLVTALNAPTWDRTLYVPQTANSQAVQASGRNVMLTQRGSNNWSAVWIANGYVYHLSGWGAQFQTKQSILAAVKGISG